MINRKYTNLDVDYIETLEFNNRYLWDQTSNTYQTLQVNQVVHDIFPFIMTSLPENSIQVFIMR